MNNTDIHEYVVLQRYRGVCLSNGIHPVLVNPENVSLSNGIICILLKFLIKINSCLLYIKVYILRGHYQQLQQKRL